MKIRNIRIGGKEPTYFIADIASNHGGNLELAKELIVSAAQAGTNAVKFQNFTAESLVSDYGFTHLKVEAEHQKKWKNSVYDSYDDASIPPGWTTELKDFAHQQGVAYFTSTYSREILNETVPYIDAIKIGSGDLTYHDLVEDASQMELPLLVATGASTMEEVRALVQVIQPYKREFVLMQCNTNYTATVGDSEDKRERALKSINLRVLETFQRSFPDAVLGLSDHTHGAMTVLGAVGLFGARVIEKHFTLDNRQKGQDHSFSMTPDGWKEMMAQTQDVQSRVESCVNFDQRLQVVEEICGTPENLRISLGDGVKRIELNELATVQVQRRSLRSIRNMSVGEQISVEDLVALRPAPREALAPYQLNLLCGKCLKRSIVAGDNILMEDVE